MRLRTLLSIAFLAACGKEAPSTPDAAPFSCDPTEQDCPEGKCTYVDPEGDGFTRACVEDGGAAALGEACTRFVEGNAGFGHDDCAPGLFCSFIGVLPPSAGGSRLCRAICDVDTPCPGTEQCARLVDEPAQGFCGQPCTPFGTDCANGMTCADPWFGIEDELAIFVTCRLPGTAPAGAACEESSECAADLICFDPFGPTTCRPLCDDAHPCASGSCLMPSPDAAAGACFES